MRRTAAKHIAAARELNEKFPDILNDFHQVLARHGMQEFTINSMEFLHGPSTPAAVIDCPPGTIPTTTCVPKPGGGVQCFTVCVPSPGGTDAE